MKRRRTSKVFIIESEKLNTEVFGFLLERELKSEVYPFFSLDEIMLYLHLRPSFIVIDGDIIDKKPKIFLDINDSLEKKNITEKPCFIIFNKSLKEAYIPYGDLFDFHNVFVDENFEDMFNIIKYLMEDNLVKVH